MASARRVTRLFLVFLHVLILCIFILTCDVQRACVCVSMVGALPIAAPDLSTCHLPFYLPEGEEPFNCCAPQSDEPAVEYSLPNVSSKVRVRRPAHRLDSAYVEKLRLAYRLMRELPDDDPRSFRQQANIHCAYCNSVYLEPNTSVYYEVHQSWLFFPFHRWYLHFHERILARLLGEDDSFALPFWNYDHPDGASMPSAYVSYAELSDALRQPGHTGPPSVVMLDSPYNPTATEQDPRLQLEVNARVMYHVMVSGATTRFAFFGEPLRAGQPVMPGIGTVEQTPHNTVHSYVGDYVELGWKDMGSLYAAARDPIFYAHHANIDRLWDVWKGLDPATNTDIDDPDYLDSGFTFYDEDARLVHVTVRDALDSARMGFTYEDVELPWLDARPSPASNATATEADITNFCILDGETPITEPCSVMVGQHVEQLIAVSSALQETLVIRGIKVEGDLVMDKPARFDVFVNLPSADERTSLACTEYAGSFSMLPQFLPADQSLQTSLRLASLGFIVKELALSDQASIVVTIVPKTPNTRLSISSISIHYDSSDSERCLAELVPIA